MQAKASLNLSKDCSKTRVAIYLIVNTNQALNADFALFLFVFRQSLQSFDKTI